MKEICFNCDKFPVCGIMEKLEREAKRKDLDFKPLLEREAKSCDFYDPRKNYERKRPTI